MFASTSPEVPQVHNISKEQRVNVLALVQKMRCGSSQAESGVADVDKGCIPINIDRYSPTPRKGCLGPVYGSPWEIQGDLGG